MEIQDYTDSEFKHALARNLRSLTRGKKSSKQPIAILLGGQSGAGKTTIHRIKQKEFQGNIVIIDGDSFRSQHPHYLELTEMINGYRADNDIRDEICNFNILKNKIRDMKDQQGNTMESYF
ncbi:zeta toxin [Streptococcus pneumoniae]|uniref:zeta toxin family protein n=1 Tax=Streptococcus pneumoniae TaxID=1313 RepID=UPI0005DC18A3|nr:zeta toxin [Streptococcus pneumoniae]CJJ60917.1 zeta toxin [Streptococcus pneumoniae]